MGGSSETDEATSEERLWPAPTGAAERERATAACERRARQLRTNGVMSACFAVAALGAAVGLALAGQAVPAIVCGVFGAVEAVTGV